MNQSHRKYRHGYITFYLSSSLRRASERCRWWKRRGRSRTDRPESQRHLHEDADEMVLFGAISCAPDHFRRLYLSPYEESYFPALDGDRFACRVCGNCCVLARPHGESCATDAARRESG